MPKRPPPERFGTTGWKVCPISPSAAYPGLHPQLDQLTRELDRAKTRLAQYAAEESRIGANYRAVVVQRDMAVEALEAAKTYMETPTTDDEDVRAYLAVTEALKTIRGE